MSYYFIAIGGSGAKVMESLTHLCAAGMMPTDEKMHLLNIDPDVGNGNLARSSAALHCYEQFQEIEKGHKTPLFKTKVELANPFTWNPTEHNKCLDDVMSYQAYKNDAIGHLFEVLYTQKERETLLNEGFRGHPSIGAAVMAKKAVLDTDNDDAQWDWLKSRVNQDVKSGQKVKIVLAGSIFGGTGAAGLPTIAKLLQKSFDEYQKDGSVVLGGVLILPYFSFTVPSDDELEGQVVASSENFLTNTKAALRYYSIKNKEENIFSSMYFIGDSKLERVNNFSVGSSSQENDAHLVDFYGALAALDFFQSDSEHLKNCSYISHSQQEKFEWSDLPTMKLKENDTQKDVSLSERLGQYVRFIFSYLHLVKPVLHDLSTGKTAHYKYPWFVDYLQDITTDSQEIKRFEEYAEYFVRWLSQLTRDSGSRQISLINPHIIQSVKPVQIDGGLLQDAIVAQKSSVTVHEVWYRLCEGHKETDDTRSAKGFGRFLRDLYDSCK
jgi:hypothetical protein